MTSNSTKIDYLEKYYRFGQATHDTPIALCITKATNTLPVYVLHTVFHCNKGNMKASQFYDKRT
jgi:hypothetical protein